MIASPTSNRKQNRISSELCLNFIPPLERNILEFNYEVFIESKDKKYSFIEALRNVFSFFAFWHLFTIFSPNKNFIEIPFSFLIHNTANSKINKEFKEKGFLVELNGKPLFTLFANGLVIIDEKFNFDDYCKWDELDDDLLKLLYDWIEATINQIKSNDYGFIDCEQKELLICFFNNWLDDIEIDEYDSENSINILDQQNKIFFLSIIDRSILNNYILTSVKKSTFYHPEKEVIIFWDGWIEPDYSESVVYGLIKAKNIYRFLYNNKNEFFMLGDTGYKCINIDSLFTDNCYLIDKNTPFEPNNVDTLKFLNDDKGYQFLFPVNPKGISFFKESNLCKNYSFSIKKDKTIFFVFIFTFASNKKLTIQKKFLPSQIVSIILPMTCIWPNFKSESWHNYYFFIDQSEKNINSIDFRFRGEIHSEITNSFEEYVDKEDCYKIIEFDTYPGSTIEIFDKKDKVEFGFFVLRWVNVESNMLETRHFALNLGSRNTSIYYTDTIHYKVIEKEYPIKPFQFKGLNLFIRSFTNANEILKTRIFQYFISPPQIKDEQSSYPTIFYQYRKPRKPLSFLRYGSLVFGNEFSLNNFFTQQEIVDSDNLDLNVYHLDIIKEYLVLLLFFLTAHSYADGKKFSIFHFAYPSSFNDDQVEYLKKICKESLTHLTDYYKGELFKNFSFISENEAIAKYFYKKDTFSFDPCTPSVILDIGGKNTKISILHNKIFENNVTAYGSDQVADCISKNKQLLSVFYNLLKTNNPSLNIKETEFASKFQKNSKDAFNITLREIRDYSTLNKDSKDVLAFVFYLYFYCMSTIYYTSMYFCRFISKQNYTCLDTVNLNIVGNGFFLNKPFFDIFGLDLNKSITEMFNHCINKFLHGAIRSSVKIFFSNPKESPICYGVLVPIYLKNYNFHTSFLSGETSNWSDTILDVFNKESTYFVGPDKDYLITFKDCIFTTFDLWQQNIQSSLIENKIIKQNCTITLKDDFLVSDPIYKEAIKKIRSDITLKELHDSFFVSTNKILLQKYCNFIFQKLDYK